MSRPAPTQAPAGPFAPPTGAPVAPASGQVAVPAPAEAARPRGRTRGRRTESQAREGGLSTPTTLGWLRALALLATLVFGLTTVAMMLQARHAMDTASANTTQYLRAQEIQANLLSAHARAANGFLLGGGQAREQQEAFAADLARANRLTTEAAEAEPGDRQALRALSESLTRYTLMVESARAANGQGLAVGQTRLDEASRILSDEALPLLGSVADANNKRIEGNTTTTPAIWTLLTGALALGALLLASVVTARRTHRVLNPGLLLAMIGVAVATWLAFTGMTQANAAIRGTRDGDLQTARAASAARAAAYDAKAMESLSLVSRASSGGPAERQWNMDSYRARTALKAIPDATLSSELQTAFRGYVLVHRRIRELDYGGEHEAAVARATGGGAEDANARFQAFDDAITRAVETAGTDAARRFQTTGGELLRSLLAVLGLTLAAMTAASVGIGQRLKEYQ